MSSISAEACSCNNKQVRSLLRFYYISLERSKGETSGISESICNAIKRISGSTLHRSKRMQCGKINSRIGIAITDFSRMTLQCEGADLMTGIAIAGLHTYYLQCRTQISEIRNAIAEFQKVDLQCEDWDLMTGIAITDFSRMNLQCQ